MPTSSAAKADFPGFEVIFPKHPQTTHAVAAHYDELDMFYREIWGEHVHHGYWATGRETASQAVLALIELLAERLRLAPGQLVCDIGCGYGGTARHLAKRHGVNVIGLTVSAAQAQWALARSGDGKGVSILHRDWLANGLADGCFDRAYAVESSEHMQDKQLFFNEAFRTLKPDGLFAVCAWLACDKPRTWEVKGLLEPICREGRLPSMGDEADYQAFAARAGFHPAGVEDLSRQVRRTWSVCLRRTLMGLATQPRYRRFLMDRTMANRIFAVTLLRIMIAYRTRSMRYCLMLFHKPWT